MIYFNKRAAFTAIAIVALTTSANAQTCPSGEALYAAFEKDYSSSNDTRARAILYWQDTGASAVDHLGKIYTSLSECRKGLCATGDEDYPEVAAMKTFYSDTFRLENGYSDKQPVYAGFDAPPPAMLRWAEERLGCTAGPTLAERTAPAPHVVAAAPQPYSQPQPEAQSVSQSTAVTPVPAAPEPISACNLTPEELKQPHMLYNRDKMMAVVAWWALNGKEGLPLIGERIGQSWAAQAFGPWSGTPKDVKSGELNQYGIPYDKKMVKAFKKYKPLPLDRVTDYPSYEAMAQAVQLYGDCFGDRSAAIDFEQIGLVRGNFSANVCNSAAAMPDVKEYNKPTRGIHLWGKAQLEHNYKNGCGYIPAMAYDFAMKDTTAGAKAADFARRVAEEKKRNSRPYIMTNADKAADQRNRARISAAAAAERDRAAAAQQARQQAADAAYQKMITDANNKPPAPPRPNRRDCYNQGDGTEKCFID